MKKMYKYLAFAASVAVLAASCEKSQTVHQNAIPDENTPETGSYDPEKYLLGFSASFEKTRADLDDAGTITWAEGDKVKVFNSEGGSALYSYHGTDFEPDGTPLEKNGEEMQACFPADNYTWDTDHVKFTMPEAFEFLNGIQNPMAGVVPADADETTSVELKNLGGIYEVKLVKAKEYGETVTKLELGNTDVNITGSATLSFTDGVPAIGALDGATSFTVEFASPVTLTSTAKSVYFFLPAAELSGMYVKAVFGKTVGGVTYEPYEQKTRNGSMSIARGGRKNMTFSVNGFFSGGDGSEDNPYLISSADDFMAIATLANAAAEAGGNGYNADAKRTFFGSAGVHYKQTGNIDFENATLTPIGNVSSAGNANNASSPTGNAFSGTFDGGNHTVKNFSANVTVADNGVYGLFGYVQNATIKNLSVEADLTLKAAATADAGVLAGTVAGSTIENVTVNATLTVPGADVDNKRFTVGGIAGFVFGTPDAPSLIKDCTVTATATVESGKNTKNGATCVHYGGIVGFSTTASGVTEIACTLDHCVNNGTITAKSGRSAGIVAAANLATLIRNCVNNATHTNSFANARIAQIVCNLGNYSGVVDCTNNGDLTTTDAKTTTGGMVALFNGDETYLEGGTNTGTIITGFDPSTDGNNRNFSGIIGANINKFKYVKDFVVSGKYGHYKGAEAPEMATITAENFRDYIGYRTEANDAKITGLTYVAP
jgi:hypothetical protein